jgi:hypothetical protein
LRLTFVRRCPTTPGWAIENCGPI